MTIRNSAARWGSLARGLHWGVFMVMMVVVLIAQVMEHPPLGITEKTAVMWHKSIGMIVLAMVVVRIVWRVADAAPQEMPAAEWQQSARRLVHLGLYGVMVMLPVTGYVMSVAGGKPWAMFGMFTVPNVVGIDPGLKMLAKQSHFFFVDCFWWLLAAHVVAVIKHVHESGHGIIERMAPAFVLKRLTAKLRS